MYLSADQIDHWMERGYWLSQTLLIGVALWAGFTARPTPSSSSSY
jgi:hypothetical protein